MKYTDDAQVYNVQSKVDNFIIGEYGTISKSDGQTIQVNTVNIPIPGILFPGTFKFRAVSYPVFKKVYHMQKIIELWKFPWKNLCFKTDTVFQKNTQ